jgi:hypothetical protein
MQLLARCRRRTGHFCCPAREVWPETAFDGVDLGEGIEEAARRRVDRGHRGLFTEFAVSSSALLTSPA